MAHEAIADVCEVRAPEGLRLGAVRRRTARELVVKQDHPPHLRQVDGKRIRGDPALGEVQRRVEIVEGAGGPYAEVVACRCECEGVAGALLLEQRHGEVQDAVNMSSVRGGVAAKRRLVGGEQVVDEGVRHDHPFRAYHQTRPLKLAMPRATSGKRIDASEQRGARPVRTACMLKRILHVSGGGMKARTARLALQTVEVARQVAAASSSNTVAAHARMRDAGLGESSTRRRHALEGMPV